ncbi:hypothetical protein LHV56_19125 [Peribacillus frigoritolerans]|uniref:hypothetical protein n=1 Tax=Peribacillus frigoritolerans TaxID=450367 RepID=UPI002079969F|nr:hypothetical protein [Peribacillus frigoritolerans]USK78946.1 hypothetical protein LHV56_19125 [Peribacillus frigoritolerans]
MREIKKTIRFGRYMIKNVPHEPIPIELTKQYINGDLRQLRQYQEYVVKEHIDLEAVVDFMLRNEVTTYDYDDWRWF